MNPRLLLGIALSLLLAPAVARAQTPAFTATVTSDAADLRDKSAATGTVVDHVFKGAKLPAFGLSGDKQWVKVKGPAGTAWVARAQVQVTKGAPEEAAPTSTPTVASTTGTGSKGTTGTSSGTKSNTGSSSTSGSGTRSGGSDGAKKYAYVVSPKSNVLLNASDSSPTVSVASKNDTFEVGGFSRDKSYVKVKLDDGRIGWIAKGDLHPGRPEPSAGDKPKTRTKPKDDFANTGSGFTKPPRKDDFADTGSGFKEPKDPPPARRHRTGSPSDTKIWADGGVVLFHETVKSDQGYGYDLNGTGFGGGIRFDRKLSGVFGIEGGYLGTMNQRLPAQGSSTTVFSTLHRIDVAGRARLQFGDEETGPAIYALAGIQNTTFYVQPQSLNFFYSQIYNSGAIGAGGEYQFSNYRFGLEARYFVPVIAGERYGSGAKGADGQSVKSVGSAIALKGDYHFYSGASLGLSIRYLNYASAWNGEGLRGTSNNGVPTAVRVTGVTVADTFTSVTLTYARGF